LSSLDTYQLWYRWGDQRGGREWRSSQQMTAEDLAISSSLLHSRNDGSTAIALEARRSLPYILGV
jgi:hypothetical protein